MKMCRQFSDFSIGVDRGGTLTRVLALGYDGAHLRETHFPTEEGINSFTKKLAEIIKEWSAEKKPLAIASRGALTIPAVRESIISGLEGRASIKAVISDAEAAHLAAFGENKGLLLISGTGSVLLAGKRGGFTIYGGKNPVSGDPGSGRWLGRQWLIKHGLLKEDEPRSHAESASYAMLLLSKAERHHNNIISKKELPSLKNDECNNKAAIEEEGKFCLETARKGAKSLAGLIAQAAKENPAFIEGNTIRAAVTGGTMNSYFYITQIIAAMHEIMPNLHAELFPIPETAQEAAAKLAARLAGKPSLKTHNNTQRKK
ncbi:MAG: hypothetical protein K5838_06645 [Elusimicrobiales bacterium]|nr:hypothetical protein [Elusimicrobiales bacterium]